MMNEEYNDLPVFWDEVINNWVRQYCSRNVINNKVIVAKANYLMKTRLHNNLEYLKKAINELVRLGYIDDENCFYRITEKGIELARFHGFID